MSNEDVAIIISVFALAMSGIGTWVTVLARRDSKQSAEEAKRARKLVQLNVLGEQFSAVERYISAMNRERSISKEELYKSIEAIEILKDACPSDIDLINVLVALEEPAYTSDEEVKGTPRLAGVDNCLENHLINISGWAPANLLELKATFKRAKAQYVTIG